MKSKRLGIFIIISILFTNSIIAQNTGYRTDEFDRYYRAQTDLMWCWAASAEMILASKGIRIPQDQIVSRVRGMPTSSPGSLPEMIRTANGVFRDSDNKIVLVSGQYVLGAPITNVLYNSIKQKKPVILTYNTNNSIGHAVVIYGIDAMIQEPLGARVTAFYIADPFCYVQYPSGFIKDDSLRYKIYHPQSDPMGQVFIEAGIITGVILIDGTKN